jgi:tetratricopeptide (TPR) repeat protein
MPMGGNRAGVQVFLFFALACPTSWAQTPQTADQKLTLGARLVSDNCGECEGRNISEFDRGVALIEQAVREGVKERRKAMLLLADAYGEYAFSYDKQRPMSETTRSSWRERVADVYRELLRDNPNDIPLLLGYANVLEDKQEALKIYQHILEIQPDTASAAFYVAILHVETGDVKIGVEEFVSALGLKSADPELIENLLPQFDQDLRAENGSQYIPEVSAAAAKALEARRDKKAHSEQNTGAGKEASKERKQ